MAINPLNGGAMGGNVFADSSGNFSNINGNPVSGKYVSAVGTPSPIKYNNSPYLLNKTSNGQVVVEQINTNRGNGHRLNWIELR